MINIAHRQFLAVSLAAFLLALGFSAAGQQPGKLPRIGVLMSGSIEPRRALLGAFQQALGALGYTEGKNIAFDYRFSEGKDERLPELAADLVQRKVDVIVTSGIAPARAARNATQSIPIVMGAVGDAIGTGLVHSLARPGGNVTGLTLLAPELTGKRLELLKETVPNLARVAVLINPANPGANVFRKEVELAAKSLGVGLYFVAASNPGELVNALTQAKTRRAQALLILNDTMFYSQQEHIAGLVGNNGLPAIFPESEYVSAGGLMSYGPSVTDSFRRAATYVDKILKGRKPADLPVEQPMTFELVINLNAATQLGLTVPPTVLMRADRTLK